MARNLILVEFKEEARFFLDNHPEFLRKDAKVISLLPESSVVLSAAGVSFETTLNYFPKDSHKECLKRVDEIITTINAVVKVQDSYGLKQAYLNTLTFYSRLYISYWLEVIEVINNVLSVYSATKLHVCGYLDSDPSGFGLLAKERVLVELAGLFKDRIEICPYALKIPRPCKPDFRKNILKVLISSVMFPLEMVRLEKFRKDPLVFYSIKYYFDRIARYFKESDRYNVVPGAKTFTRFVDPSAGMDLHNIHAADVLQPKDRRFETSWRRALDEVKAVHYRTRLFSYRGYDFSSAVFKKWELGYGPQLGKLNRQTGALKKFYSKLKPAAILSHVARDFSYALGELAKLMDIPSVLISHGSHVPPNNPFDKMEWLDHGKGLVHTDYTYHLLQSPWAVEHVKTMGHQGNYYAIEPLIFPKVDRSQKSSLQLKMFPQSEGKKVFVHAGTPKPRGANRFYIYETLDEYIAYMGDLVEAARRMPDIFLVIRFRPSAYISTEDLKALLPKDDHYVIATDGPFADYLKIADVMVSFSSTTIEEALINRIPVLEYDPSDRYMHIPGVKWQDKGFAHVDSVYYIGDRINLAPGLRWIMDNHLNAAPAGDLFERHVFGPGEAITVEEFIERLIKKDLPQPITLSGNKYYDKVETY